MDMTNYAAAALAIIPILSFLCLVVYIYAAHSQDVPNTQRDDYLNQFKDEINKH
jgi:hypothetical protein